MVGHRPLPRSQPSPDHWAAEVSPCWSSVTLTPSTAHHSTPPSTEASQKQQRWQGGAGPGLPRRQGAANPRSSGLATRWV
ncbi:hypothetical protein I79_012411 [Cricetulus griseus]|uniref:Uncharacterized protein n=1 Tax=Cricetulus griseus TaxID=10029 RepID=G3HNR8_CRIGR|nr:hypothetical protein I79_012411 [Cricetulus griseus]